MTVIARVLAIYRVFTKWEILNRFRCEKKNTKTVVFLVMVHSAFCTIDELSDIVSILYYVFRRCRPRRTFETNERMQCDDKWYAYRADASIQRRKIKKNWYKIVRYVPAHGYSISLTLTLAVFVILCFAYTRWQHILCPTITST